MPNDTDAIDLLLLHPVDDVAVAKRNLPIDAIARLSHDRSVKLVSPITFGHKVALRDIGMGEWVRKFGQVIGRANRSIAAGEHVHDHNLDCDRQTSLTDAPRAEATQTPKASTVPSQWLDRLPSEFMGYQRPDGRVGTRNYIVVAASVNCSAFTSRKIAEYFTPERLRPFPNIDGIMAITHKSGCGMHDVGRDRQVLKRTLSGFISHPNVGGALLVGLGCEVNQASQVFELHPDQDRLRTQVPRFEIQASGGVQATIKRGIAAIEAMLPKVNDIERVPTPVSKLILGTNCGGSDAYSGITANPALGVASDILVTLGGTSVLAETTEVYGAEQLLISRAKSPSVANKLLARIKWWEEYAGYFGATINNNPSQGNKEGGLSTIFEKSLGAIAKGGSTTLVDVLDYAESINQPGFLLMDTPGFDPVSVTGLVAGGCNMIVFTTGRGSAFGCKPTPSIKVATSSALFGAMPDDMDVDAGTILLGESVEAAGRRIYQQMIEVANGRKTKSEEQGIGDDEFAPWLIGPVL